MKIRSWEENLGRSHTGLIEEVGEIVKNLNKNIKILDIGCGVGDLEAYLFNKGFNNIVGVDISKNALKIAKQKTPHYIFRQQNIEKSLPFGNKKFDVVFCIEVLQHITNPVFVMKEMLRVGKNIIITCPNGFWTEIRPITKGYLQDPNYIHFTEKQLKNVIREIGGKITSFKYFTLGFKFFRNIYPRFFSTGFIVVIR